MSVTHTLVVLEGYNFQRQPGLSPIEEDEGMALVSAANNSTSGFIHDDQRLFACENMLACKVKTIQGQEMSPFLETLDNREYQVLLQEETEYAAGLPAFAGWPQRAIKCAGVVLGALAIVNIIPRPTSCEIQYPSNSWSYHYDNDACRSATEKACRMREWDLSKQAKCHEPEGGFYPCVVKRRAIQSLYEGCVYNNSSRDYYFNAVTLIGVSCVGLLAVFAFFKFFDETLKTGEAKNAICNKLNGDRLTRISEKIRKIMGYIENKNHFSADQKTEEELERLRIVADHFSIQQRLWFQRRNYHPQVVNQSLVSVHNGSTAG